jgi:uncharacterized protein (DUF433 family)
MNMRERITTIEGLCNGEPTIRGMRMRVSTIVEHVADGESEEAILKEFPFLTSNDIKAALEYASQHAQ